MFPAWLWRFIPEVIILYYLFYRLGSLVRGTSLFLSFKWLPLFFLLAGASNFLGFRELKFFWELLIFTYLAGSLIVFQPELRRVFFNRIHHRGESVRDYFFQDEENRSEFINNIALACQTLSRKKIGALIVLERSNNLRDFIQTGVVIDAFFSPELLFSLFLPESPLHDGAAILRENRIVAAGCILPLAESTEVKKLVGTRHRAGIGITEQTDALALVVSEETGKISLAVHGKMAWDIEIGALKKMLKILYKKV